MMIFNSQKSLPGTKPLLQGQSCPLNPLLTLSDCSRICLNICQTIYDLLESFFITHKNSMNVFAFGRLGTVTLVCQESATHILHSLTSGVCIC